MSRGDREPRLLDVDPTERGAHSRALVPLDRDTCANCGATLVEDSTVQPALFRHGGYGETQRGSALWCPVCGWQGAHARTAENPRERPHKGR